MGLIQVLHVNQMELPTITLVELWALYEAGYLTRLKASSQRVIRATLAPVLRALGDRPAISCDLDAADWYAGQRIGQPLLGSSRPASEATVSAEMRRASAMLRWGVKRRKIPYNPLQEFEALGNYQRRRVALTEAQVRRILAVPIRPSVQETLRAAVLCLYSSGCRAREVIDGRWEWLEVGAEIVIDGEIRRVNIYRLPAEATKTGKARVAFFSDEAVAALQVLGQRTPWLMVEPGQYENLRQQWREAAARSGVDRDLGTRALLHHLRHSLGTDMMLGGAPPTVVRDSMGHENLSTTSIYSHTNLEAIARAYLETWEGREDRVGPKPMRPAGTPDSQQRTIVRKRH